MQSRCLSLLAVSLTLAVGCTSEAPPNKKIGATRESLTGKIKDSVPTITVTETETATNTSTSTATQTATATQTGIQTATSTATRTGSAPGIYQQIYTFTGIVTSTGTAIVYYVSWPHSQGNTATATTNQFASGTAVATVTRTVTSPFNSTETKTASATVSGSGTSTGTATVTVTATVTTSTTNAGTGTRTVTATGIATGTALQTWTATWTTQVTQTVTNTATSTVTNTNTVTNTMTVTNTWSQTATQSHTSSSTSTTSATTTTTSVNTQTSTTTSTITTTMTLTGTSVDAGIDAPSGGTPQTFVPCAAKATAVTAAVGDVVLMVNSGALVDSYTSGNGLYGGSNIGSNGNVVAAGTITKNGGVINGQQSPNTPSNLPMPTIPSNAVNLPIGSSSPGSLNINQAADSVTLAPGAYVVQNLNVNYSGAINISPVGMVTIFVTGSLNLGGIENLNGVPANLTFVVTQTGWVNVNSNGQLFGGIYAPTSGINLNSTVYGYVVGGSVTLNSGAAVHYDQGEACGCYAPVAPDSVSASASPGRVTLSWSASAGATMYSVKRATTSGGPYTTIASSVVATKYTDTDQPNPSLHYGATVYYYVVTASNGCGNSGLSSEASGNSAVLMPPRSLPAPPKDVGCYVGIPGGWQVVACTPSAQMDPIFLGPHVVSEPSIHSVPVAGTTIPFQFGQIDTTIVTYTPTEKSLSTDDSLSLQLNTNHFPGTGGLSSSGHEYLYQFVLLTHGTSQAYIAGGTGICIEPVDRTVACQGYDAGSPCWNIAAYDFDDACVGGVSVGAYNIGNSRGFRAFDFATLAVSTFPDSGVAKIGLVAQFSWFDPNNDQTSNGNGNGLYAVVTTDDFGLGLQGHWTSMSGTLIGLGGGYSADFVAPSSVLTRSLAGSCVIPGTGPFAGIPWPGACPNPPSSFLPYTQNTMDNITVETNNLTIVGDPSSLVSYEPDLVFSEYLASTDGNCQADNGLVYVKDSAEDTGVIPTNTGGQPFWASPDILFVLPGESETVDENTTSSGSLISFGQTYDFYVRVHNDLGCSDAKGVKARLFVADPSSLMQEWTAISGDGYSVGPTQPSGGITVPARQAKMIGPFTWTAPQGTGSLHKCLLAAIESDKQGAPDAGNGTLPEAYLSNQVAQRNVQFEDCSWQLPSTQAGKVTITVTTNGAKPQLGGSTNHIQVIFDDPNGNWNNIWNAYASPNSYSSTYDGVGKTTVRLGASYVELHPVPIAANANPVATVTMTQMQMAASVDFNASLLLNGATKPIKQNGSTCVYNFKIIE